jgi:hypothetical protein
MLNHWFAALAELRRALYALDVGVNLVWILLTVPHSVGANAKRRFTNR